MIFACTKADNQKTKRIITYYPNIFNCTHPKFSGCMENVSKAALKATLERKGKYSYSLLSNNNFFAQRSDSHSN